MTAPTLPECLELIAGMTGVDTVLVRRHPNQRHKVYVVVKDKDLERDAEIVELLLPHEALLELQIVPKAAEGMIPDW